MPAPSGVEMRWARIEGGAFDFQGNFKKAIGILFLWAIYLTLARSLFFGVLAVVQKWRARRAVFDPDFHPPVSVIVAAYNEEKVIVRTVESILRNGYADLEIVIVDDGSKTPRSMSCSAISAAARTSASSRSPTAASRRP